MTGHLVQDQDPERPPLLTPARAWTGVACTAFLIATAYAIAVVVFRLPIEGVYEPRLFRIALALHVELAVFFWLTSTSAAVWSAANGTKSRRVDLILPALALSGTLLLALSPAFGGDPLMADYFPWIAHNQVFAAGFVLFAVAIVLTAASAARNLLIRRERADWSRAGLSALPVLSSIATAAVDFMAGAHGVADLAWGAGHTLLFSHVTMMCWEWAILAGVLCRREVRASLNALVAIALLLPTTGLFFTPGSTAHQQAFTLAMSLLLWPPALVVGIIALGRATGANADAGTDRGMTRRQVVGLSFAFFVCGNLLGSMIDNATTLVTAHYHASIGAVALSRMAMLYAAATQLAFAVPTARAAKLQLFTYAIALTLLFSGLTLGAVDGSPRKTSAGELHTKGPYFRVGMSISGVGGLFAIAGSLWLVVNLTSPRKRCPGLCQPKQGAVTKGPKLPTAW